MGLQSIFEQPPLFSMRKVSLVTLHSCRSVGADAQCKRALRTYQKAMSLSLSVNAPNIYVLNDTQ